MALRKIRLSDDPFLRKKSKPVKEVNDKIKTLLDDMKETMYDNNGIGLAAPQIGVLKKIIIIQLNEESELFELINPEIIETKGLQVKNEACLSVPRETGYVERPTYVKVKALNRLGEEIIVEGEELLAVALCHETDHLDGVLYTDKLVFPEEEDEE